MHFCHFLLFFEISFCFLPFSSGFSFIVQPDFAICCLPCVAPLYNPAFNAIDTNSIASVQSYWSPQGSSWQGKDKLPWLFLWGHELDAWLPEQEIWCGLLWVWHHTVQYWQTQGEVPGPALDIQGWIQISLISSKLISQELVINVFSNTTLSPTVWTPLSTWSCAATPCSISTQQTSSRRWTTSKTVAAGGNLQETNSNSKLKKFNNE